MAKNGAFITGSDICVSITGLAGPDGGTETTPVGLVYIACAYQNELRIREFHFKGNRQKIRELSTVNALTLLRNCILEKEPLEIKQKLPFRRNPSGSFFMLLLFDQTHHHADFFNPGYFFF